MSFGSFLICQVCRVCLESVEVNIAFHGPMLELTKKLEPLGITSATYRHVDTPDSMVNEDDEE